MNECSKCGRHIEKGDSVFECVPDSFEMKRVVLGEREYCNLDEVYFLCEECGDRKLEEEEREAEDAEVSFAEHLHTICCMKCGEKVWKDATHGGLVGGIYVEKPYPGSREEPPEEGGMGFLCKDCMEGNKK